MHAIWLDTAQLPSFPPLLDSRKADVLIIGGGMAGLLCAHRLASQGVDAVVAEADTICSGVTRFTTAKITSQHGLIYSKLLQTYGKETAKLYLEAQEAALGQYRALCQTADCDFEETNTYVYALDNRKAIDKELRALEEIGAPASFAANLPLPFSVAGAVRFSNQAQFHPLKLAAALAPRLQIYEHTRVLELAPGRAVTDHGTIQAEHIIVATHFPFLNKHGGYFLKLYQHRSYVLALQNAPTVNGCYVDESKTGLSFRNYGALLLLGGGGHRTGKHTNGWQPLSAFARRFYPQAREVGRWATQDCMTLDGIPYIGSYSKRTPNLYVATGFNKWGMSSAMVSAMVLTDRILGRDNPYASVFSPSRSSLHPQLVLNAAEAVRGLLTPTAPRCPHMGCALKYNRQEHSWDCSCHGSRFSEEGRLLDNPATGDKDLPRRQNR